MERTSITIDRDIFEDLSCLMTKLGCRNWNQFVRHAIIPILKKEFLRRSLKANADYVNSLNKVIEK